MITIKSGNTITNDKEYDAYLRASKYLNKICLHICWSYDTGTYDCWSFTTIVFRNYHLEIQWPVLSSLRVLFRRAFYRNYKMVEIRRLTSH
jgi:hypothetical protein